MGAQAKGVGSYLNPRARFCGHGIHRAGAPLPTLALLLGLTVSHESLTSVEPLQLNAVVVIIHDENDVYPWT